jgi:D-alanyl-D-alanine dipeptidase
MVNPKFFRIVLLVKLCLIGFLVVQCKSPNNQNTEENSSEKDLKEHKAQEVNEEIDKEIDTVAQRLMALGLVDVQSVNPNILVDIKYSTTDNFMGENLY